MPVHNSEVADIFNRIADLLDIKGENPFRVRAYRNAARAVGGLSRSVADLVQTGEDLTVLPGIGKDLAQKIKEIVETGTLPFLEKLRASLPPQLPELLKIQGMGPRKVKALYETLGISSPEELKRAAKEKRIRGLPGFGEKTEQGILEELERMEKRAAGKERRMLAEVEPVAEALLAYLRQDKGVVSLEAAGSYRRRRETVGDLDILAACRKGNKAMERFVNYEDVEKVLSRGETRSSVLLRSGFQVDLRVVPRSSFGAALHYFTGSKEHNIAVRKLGVKKGLKINEYGVFRGEKRVAGRTEEEVYRAVGLPYIEPELREDRGEIEAAREGKLPRLVTLEDIRGDLHVHTRYTDGRYSPAEMAEAARLRGYAYIAVTDHSQKVRVAGGMDARGLRKQIEELDALNAKLQGFRVLKSVELDILEDGSLDLPDEVLEELDFVVASIHYHFKLPREKQTERIIRAMDNPLVNILAHPTGRLLSGREPYEVNLERVMEAAAERGCFLELNGHPERMDLDDIHCKMAKDMGLKVALATDAHRIDDLDFMRFGIGQARRGWLEPEDVLNTRDWEELAKLLKRK